MSAYRGLLTALVLTLLFGSRADAFPFGPQDTTRGAPRDTAVIIDSVRIRFIPGMGALLPADSANPLRSGRFLFMDDKNVEEVLWRIPGLFLRDLGETGKPSQLTAYGSDMRSIGILVDGRPMNDPVTGGYTLSNVPIEFLDRIEYLTGSSAIGASFPGPAATVNFVTRSYNSLRPLTKIRFVQDPKETILTDLFYTQNLSRGLNLQFGIQRQSSQGRLGRDELRSGLSQEAGNAKLDGWNVRTRLRYNFSDRFNLSLTDLYTRTVNGLNGGVDAARSADPFDEVTAVVRSTNTYEILTRRDMTLAGIGRLFADSASTSHLNLYYTTSVREYASGVDLYHSSLQSDVARARFMGVRFEQRLEASPAALTVAMEHESRATDATTVLPKLSESRSAFSASASLALAEIVLRVSGRLDRDRSESGTSTGAGIRLLPAEWLTVDADWSRAYRFPTIQELYWTDSLLVRRTAPEKEQHTTTRFGVTARLGQWATVSLAVFRRDVDGGLIFRPDTTVSGTAAVGLYRVGRYRTDGVTGSGVIHLGPFELTGDGSFFVMHEDNVQKTTVPEILVGGEFVYQNRFFDGSLDVRTGLRVRYNERFRGAAFSQSSLLYYENTQYVLGRSTTLDLFGILHIGSAYISISMDNLFNSNVLTVPVYPLSKRHLRLGVNWIFLD